MNCKALNVVAQNQTRATVIISEATQRDSAVMRTVAIVTMTFLPATFVTVCTSNAIFHLGDFRAYSKQTLFSMSFFDYSPGNNNGSEAWFVSRKIWIYFLVAVPLTILTVAAWFLWQRWKDGRREGMEVFHDCRNGSKANA